MRILLAAAAVLMLFVALGADRKAMAQYERYGDLLRQYELYPLPAGVDVDADGVVGTIDVVQPDPNDRFTWVAVVRDGGRTLLRLPYDHTDNTFRTHLAWCSECGSGRLLVFDGTGTQGRQTQAVYSLQGQQLVATEPTQAEAELLAAMASRDDTGTAHSWMRYKLVRLPALWMACLVALGLAVWSARKPPARLATPA